MKICCLRFLFNFMERFPGFQAAAPTALLMFVSGSGGAKKWERAGGKRLENLEKGQVPGRLPRHPCRRAFRPPQPPRRVVGLHLPRQVS